MRKTQMRIDAENKIRINPLDFVGYEELGDSLIRHNVYQAYLCYENALFFLKRNNNSAEDFGRLQQKLNLISEEELDVPKTSFVILNFNLKNITQDCVDSIRKTTPESAREIVIIDNGSTDGSVEAFSSQSDIKLQANTENSGFPGGCNQGIRLSEKESDIFLLNNDTVLCDNSLFWLRMGLYESEANGSAGCVSNCVQNGQRVTDDNKELSVYEEYAKNNNIPNDNAYENKNYLVGFAVLIKRTVLERIGYLDEKFYPGHYEDNDLGLRILQAGYQNVLVRNSFIVHWGSKTFGKSFFGGKVVVNNRKYFCQKYGFESDKIFDVDGGMVSRFEMIKDLPEHAKILQMNCGMGMTLTNLKWKHPEYEYYGFEKNGCIANYSSSLKGINVRHYADISNLPVVDEKFDAIFLNAKEMTFSEFATAYDCLVRLLNKSGKIYLCIKNMKHFSNWIDMVIESDASKYREKIEKITPVPVSEEEVIKLVTGSNGAVVNWVFLYSNPSDVGIKAIVEKMQESMTDDKRNSLTLDSVWLETKSNNDKYGIDSECVMDSYGDKIAISWNAIGDADGVEIYVDDEPAPIFASQNNGIHMAIVSNEHQYKLFRIKQYINTERGKYIVAERKFRRRNIVFNLKPEVSVIIDARNNDGSIVQAIDSVLAQSFRKTEIIIVNDNKNNEIEKVVKWYEEHYSNIRVVDVYDDESAHIASVNRAATENIIFMKGNEIFTVNVLKNVVGGNINQGIILQKKNVLMNTMEDNSDNILISVIIPCYNVEKYLERCVNSVVNQTLGLEKIEIILIDDMSTDNTPEVMKKLKGHFPENIILKFNKEKHLCGGSRNIGIDVAKGKYISFVDADDYLHPEMLIKLYEKAEEYNTDIVECLAKEVNDNGEGDERRIDDVFYDFQKNEDLRKNLLLNISRVQVWAKIFKTSYLKENKIYYIDKLVYEDVHYNAINMFMCNSIYILGEQLYYYYKNETSITHSIYDSKKEMEMFRILEHTENELIARGLMENINLKFRYEYVAYMTYKGYFDSMDRAYVGFDRQKEFYKNEILRIFPDAVDNPYLKNVKFPTNREYMKILGANIE